jgi:hypothetical protein
MTLSSLSLTQRTTPQEAFDTDKVRTLIAEYLGIDRKQVTDEARISVTNSAWTVMIASN